MTNTTYTLTPFALERFQALNHDEQASLLDLFDATCERFGDKTAFYCVDETLSFAELNQRSRALAGYLEHSLGLSSGDRIAIQLPNILAYPIAAWAAWRAGLVVVNTNPMYTAPELKHQLNDSGARAIITLTDLVPLIQSIKDDLGLEHIIAADLPGADPTAAENLSGNALSLVKACALGDATPSSEPHVSMADIAVLQYTSGTTGASKGAVLTHANLYSSSSMTRLMFNDETPDAAVVVAPMPLYHIYGFTGNVLNVFLGGGASVLIPNARNIDTIIDAFCNYPVTSIAGVNTLYLAILAHPKFDQIDFSHFRVAISGGATLVKEVSDQWIARTGTNIYEGYGLSETSSVLSCNSDEFNQLGTVGRSLPFQELRIVSPEGESLAVGEEGEIQVRGPHVMCGYWNRPEETVKVLDQEGWFKTGDVGILQSDGFIRVVDRLKDLIIVSGFNVYPNEVEGALYQHESVVECAVVGRADKKSGEAVVAYIVSNTSSLTEQEVRDFCRTQLAAYKVPKDVRFVEALPKSNVGKILRRALRD